ncbi:MAG: hypothetical protein HZC10_03895 [Nitrospirae bacterium]|nr:hypothetical protein [Nitrospirota bacterium]
MKRLVLILIFLNLVILFTACAATSKTQSNTSPPAPKDLIGRWEGTAAILGTNFPNENISYFALEIFAVDPASKMVTYMGICALCTPSQWYSDKGRLIDEERFEIMGLTISMTSSPIGRYSHTNISTQAEEFRLKKDKLSGYATSFPGNNTDITLKRTIEIRGIIPQVELIGRWIGRSEGIEREFVITEVDASNKILKGSYRAEDGNVYELKDAGFIDEDNKVMVDFKSPDNKLHYQLTFFSALSDYPPVLWGKAKETSGAMSYLMFKRER